MTMSSRFLKKRVVTAADYADVVIVVVGLDETLEGEEGDTGNAYFSGDKEDLELPASQRDLLDSMLSQDKPVIVINMSGSAIDLADADYRADAVIQGWYPGARGGKVIAEILFGKASPSGKLPVTFYEDCDELPAFEDYSMKNRTYRYFTGTPLYPFGYGLTYGDCRAEGIDTVSVNKENGAEISVKINNHGAETDDVLQIYIKDNESECAVLNPALAAFKRIHLKENEEITVTVKLDPRAFTSVDEEGVRAIRSSRFTVYAGFSQPDKRSRELMKSAPVEIELNI